MINFESLKIQFLAYLEETKSSENSENSEVVDYSDVSIFSYMNEFEDFLEKEMNIDLSQMEMNTEELIGMEYNELNQIVFPENQEQSEEQNIMTGLIGELLNDENVIKTADTDGDNTLNEEERNALLKQMSAQSENTGNITLADISSSVENIQNGTFNATEQEAVVEDVADIEEEVDKIDETEAQSSSSDSGSSSSGGSFSGGDSSLGLNTNTQTQNTTTKKSLENMSETELKTELGSAQEAKTKNETALNSYLDGTNSEFQELDTELEGLYEEYQNQLKEVDVEMAKQVDEKKQEIDEQNDKIYDKETEIRDETTKKNEAQAAVNDANAQIASIESSIASLSSIDTSEMESGEAAAIQSQIAALEAAKAEAIAARDKAQEELDTATKNLERMEGTELPELKEKAAELEAQMQELETQIAEKYPQIQEAMMAYSQGRQVVNMHKIETIEAARKAFSESETYLNDVNNALKNVERKKEEKELLKEYSPDPMSQYNSEKGQHLVDTAKAMLAKYGSTTGWCATGVSRTMSMAYGIQMGGNGNDWDTNMEKLVDQGLFTEVTGNYKTSDELSNLPAGAIVCWEATGGSSGGAKYGHVTVADGKGGEISDHYQANIYKSIGGRSDQYRVFIPV